ncbi:MAG TPA: hypothetical protein PKZ97_16070, partial [Azospirillaceae bacterium]|nr:hypothetical protein [Azospirillaceae bacterium]
MSEETHSSLQGLLKRLKTAAAGGDKTGDKAGERTAESIPDAPAPDSLPAMGAPQADAGAAALGFAAGALA